MHQINRVKKSIKQFTIMFKNYRVKINLLLMAIILWIFVVTGREYETEIEIPIVTRNIKAGKTLVSDVPPYAKVRFKGVGRGLIAVQSFDKAHLELDLSTINFFYDYPLRLDQIKFSSNLIVEPMEILYPDTVLIRLEKLTEANLEVRPVIAVSTVPGYVIVGEAKAAPAKVIVSGPAALMKDIEYIETEEIHRSDLKSDLNEPAKLVMPFPQISASQDEVQVTLNIERLTEVNYRGVPVNVENPPSLYGVRLDPENVSVKVRGGVSNIKNLTKDQIIASISFPGQWSEDITKCVPLITLPPGIELIIVDPDTVIMTLVEEQ